MMLLMLHMMLLIRNYTMHYISIHVTMHIMTLLRLLMMLLMVHTVHVVPAVNESVH